MSRNLWRAITHRMQMERTIKVSAISVHKFSSAFETDPNEDNCCTTSLILKFFSLIIGGLMVFTLVYLLIQCCHDNKHVSFARVRTNRAPPCAIFMENFQSNTTLIPNEKQSKKYVLPYDDSLEYIDNEPLHTYDFPMLSPLSKGDKK
uniref:Uncharacterized protein n=1 Tax=Photinus pyralis TaxID=7054 RepID=A0A1Y1LYC6_PHOPY